jgi:hypothetical protein
MPTIQQYNVWWWAYSLMSEVITFVFAGLHFFSFIAVLIFEIKMNIYIGLADRWMTISPRKFRYSERLIGLPLQRLHGRPIILLPI